MTDLAIDGQRLWESLCALADIGATPAGGVDRPAASPEDGAARSLLARWCREAGCALTVDAVGNMFARRPGRDPQRAPIQIGSHLDTVYNGGRYDGAYGVMAALEAIRALNDRGIETEAPIELVNWTNEEGARFPLAMTGSRVFAGQMTLQDALELSDPAGVHLGDALAEIGWRGDAPVGHPVGAYLEAHIEQGTVLERAGLEVGLVSGIQARRRLRLDLGGETAHAGTCPLDRRRDALLAAARITAEVRRLALAVDERMRATVGRLDAWPGAANVVADRAEVALDVRHPDAATLQGYLDDLSAAAHRIAREEGCSLELQTLSQAPATVFDAGCRDAIAQAAETRQIRTETLVSGGGHDAGALAAIAPAGMVFVACRDGVSHNPAESITPEAAEAGCAVLADAARRLADRNPADDPASRMQP
jgi:N-carbamoyl-L-amino-acid hydrolase